MTIKTTRLLKKALTSLMVITFACLFWPQTSGATTPPIPPRKTVTLKDIESRLSEEKRQKKELEQNLKQQKHSIEELQDLLVSISSDIQNIGRDISELNKSVSALEYDEAILQRDFDKQRTSFGNIILSLQRIRRVPPEALILKPDAPLKTAQTALLLRNIIPALQTQAAELNNKLIELQSTQTELNKKRITLISRNNNLQSKNIAMDKLLKQREDRYKTTEHTLRAKEKNLVSLSESAETLRELLAKIEAQEKMERKKPTRYLETKNAKMPKAGEPRLPIYGALVTNFGEIDDIGAKSRGLTLVPSNNTPVVAPMGGIIKFANSFKNYDKMIIIEHKNGYHSLIGGLSTIKTRIGRSVKAGEPIGNMIVSPSRKDKARLYYELRHKGKTINPATKFKHLKS